MQFAWPLQGMEGLCKRKTGADKRQTNGQRADGARACEMKPTSSENSRDSLLGFILNMSKHAW